MGILSGMLSCFNPSSSARVNDKENAKEEPSLSSNHKLKSKSSGSKAPIPAAGEPNPVVLDHVQKHTGVNEHKLD